MTAATLDRPSIATHHLDLDTGQKSILAGLCLAAGSAALAPKWFSNDGPRIACGLLVMVVFLGVTLYARATPSLQRFWQLAFAFFVFALVQVLNNSIPGFVGSAILHDHPVPGNPFASTVFGTVVMQLVGTALAVVPIVACTRISGRDLGSIYVRKGVVGRWLLAAVLFFVCFYVFVATLPLRPESFAQRLLPTNGVVTFDRFITLTPALLVMAIANGLFEEEFLFRGLFLQKYNDVFNPRVSNLLQAAIFALAHAGVSYTPSALVFILVVVFPLGLVAGYLMRATRSVITPGIFHGALDMAIYLAFLSYVA